MHVKHLIEAVVGVMYRRGISWTRRSMGRWLPSFLRTAEAPVLQESALCTCPVALAFAIPADLLRIRQPRHPLSTLPDLFCSRDFPILLTTIFNAIDTCCQGHNRHKRDSNIHLAKLYKLLAGKLFHFSFALAFFFTRLTGSFDNFQ